MTLTRLTTLHLNLFFSVVIIINIIIIVTIFNFFCCQVSLNWVSIYCGSELQIFQLFH